MRATTHSLFLLASLAAAVALSGCGSGSDKTYYASTAGGSTTTPVTSGTPTNPPPTSTLLTNALVSSFSNDEVVDVDARTGLIGNRWAVGDGPTDVVNDITLSYVASALDQKVTTIDRLANNVSGSVDVTSTPITGLSLLNFADPLLKPLVRPTGLAVTPNGRKVFSANLLNVTIIDATTGAATKSILGLNTLTLANLLASASQAWSTFSAAPIRGLGMAKVAATNDHALVTCMITGTVMRIDANTDKLIGYTDVGRGPVGITIVGNKAYVACALSQEVWVLDVATGAVLSKINAGMIPVDVSANQAGTRVYVANAISGDITVIDTAADLVVATLPAGLSVASIFQQLGIQLPTGTSGGGIQSVLSAALQNFVSQMNNPSSFGSLLFNNTGPLLSPANLVNGLVGGFLQAAGITQSQMSSLNLPGIGIMSIGVAHDPSLVVSGNAFMGEMVVTEEPTNNVSTVPGLTGLGPVDIATVWRR